MLGRRGVIDAYVAELGGALRGPRRAKADLLAEARDSLVDATEAYQRGGLDCESAERAAVGEFGELDEIVPGYQAELGWAQARRTSLIVLFVFAAQPFIWDYTFRWARGLAAPEPRTGTALADTVVENLGGITILLALVAVLSHPIALRRPAVRERITRITGLAALVVCAVFSSLGVLLTVLTAGPTGYLVAIHLVWMVAFFLVPVGWIAVSARRCLALTAK